VNAYEVRQAWCSLQVKLCDPCLSALKWSLPCKALYKCLALPLPLPVNLLSTMLSCQVMLMMTAVDLTYAPAAAVNSTASVVMDS